MALRALSQNLTALWDRFTCPDDAVQGVERRRQSRLFASFSLAMSLVIFILLPLRDVLDQSRGYTNERVAAALLSGLVALGGYRLSRSGRYRTAIVLMVVYGTLAVFAVAAFMASASIRTLDYLIVLTLFVSLTFPTRMSIVYFAFQIIGMLGFAALVPGVTLTQVIQEPISFNVFMAVTITIFARYREYLEAIRKSQLGESEERYRIVSELVSDYAYCYRIEPDGSLSLEWSTDAFARIEHFARQNVSTDDLLSRFDPRDHDAVRRDFARMLEGNPVNSEFRYITHTGEIQYTHCYWRPVWDEQAQRVIRFFGVAQDTTARKRSEMQALELTVQRERTDVLTAFVRDISHDLRNPMSVINTSLHLLQKIGDPERQQQRIAVIGQQVTHMSRLIDDLHTMASLDSTSELTFSPVDVNRIVREIGAAFHEEATDRKLHFSTALAAHGLHVPADERQLRFALANLVENAFVYTPQGGRVAVRVHEANGHVVVEVEDTGIGISAEDVPHIFERFYKADKARTPGTSGAGLGLAMARRIIELHRGAIEVSSAPEQGSLFRVRLPRSLPAPDTAGIS